MHGGLQWCLRTNMEKTVPQAHFYTSGPAATFVNLPPYYILAAAYEMWISACSPGWGTKIELRESDHVYKMDSL